MRAVDPERRSLPRAEWPEFDRARWTVSLEPADLLDGKAGYASRWKPSTQGEIERGYGRWLGWLQRTGQLTPSASPGERATRERVKAYLAALRAARLADNSLAGRLTQLGNALCAIDPGPDYGWIGRAGQRLYASAVPVRDPVERFREPREIIELGEAMMLAAENDRFRTACDRATLFRDGLMLAFLIQRPLRLANLAALSLDQHLQRGEGGCTVLIDEAETKGDRVIACSWPEPLVEPLERYLDVHRPELQTGATRPRPTTALWISRQGGAMGADAIAYQISSRTEEEFGMSINPHAFRHIAASAIATYDPAGALAIASILGHSSIRTSEKYYNRATKLAAGMAYHETLKARRARSSPKSHVRQRAP